MVFSLSRSLSSGPLDVPRITALCRMTSLICADGPRLGRVPMNQVPQSAAPRWLRGKVEKVAQPVDAPRIFGKKVGNHL